MSRGEAGARASAALMTSSEPPDTAPDPDPDPDPGPVSGLDPDPECISDPEYGFGSVCKPVCESVCESDSSPAPSSPVPAPPSPAPALRPVPAPIPDPSPVSGPSPIPAWSMARAALTWALRAARQSIWARSL